MNKLVMRNFLLARIPAKTIVEELASITGCTKPQVAVLLAGKKMKFDFLLARNRDQKLIEALRLEDYERVLFMQVVHGETISKENLKYFVGKAVPKQDTDATWLKPSQKNPNKPSRHQPLDAANWQEAILVLDELSRLIQDDKALIVIQRFKQTRSTILSSDITTTYTGISIPVNNLNRHLIPNRFFIKCLNPIPSAADRVYELRKIV